MRTPDQKTLLRQMEARINAADRAINAVDKELYSLYRAAVSDIEKEVTSLIGRYGDQNGLTTAQANALLGGSEHSVWRRGIQQYVSKADADSAILRELNTLSMKSRISRHEALLGDIYGHMIALADTTEIKTGDLLTRLVKGNYYRSAYDTQKGMGFAMNIARLDEGTVRGILNHPWSGKTFSQSIWGNTDKLAVTARREISLGFIRGDSVPQMSRAINSVVNGGYQNAKRLVVTEGSRAANQGELRSLAQNGFTRYKYMAEAGTADYCLTLNGRDFRLDEAQDGVNIPPLHPNCRCIIVACFDSFYDGGSRSPFPNGLTFEEWQQKFTV